MPEAACSLSMHGRCEHGWALLLDTPLPLPLLHGKPAILSQPQLTLPFRLQAIMKLRRAAHASETQERSHLLLLYEPLCSCVASDRPRIRQALQVLLTLAGQELGLCAGKASDTLL